MDQKQLSQLDPKLKAVYDRVMGIANTPPPAPPQMVQPTPPTPPQMPPAPQRPTFVVEEIPNQHPQVMSTSQPLPQPPPPPPPPHTTQPQVFFTQDTGNVPSFRAAPQPPPSMQNLHATMPVAQMPQNSLAHQGGSGRGFMILFIILGIIFFILYGIFWVQLFNIGIPALTSS